VLARCWFIWPPVTGGGVGLVWHRLIERSEYENFQWVYLVSRIWFVRAPYNLGFPSLLTPMDSIKLSSKISLMAGPVIRTMFTRTGWIFFSLRSLLQVVKIRLTCPPSRRALY
jgi:hypothetical protein